MSAIEEIIQSLDAINEKIEGVFRDAGRADSATDDALAQAATLGASATIEGLSRVKEAIRQLLGQLIVAGDDAKQVMVTARVVAGST